jgi:hypothetical protein
MAFTDNQSGAVVIYGEGQAPIILGESCVVGDGKERWLLLGILYLYVALLLKVV